MKLTLKVNNTKLLHAVFILWLIAELAFQNTLFSRAALVMFFGVTILITHSFRWSAFLTGYGLLFVCSLLNIYLGYAVSKATASAMTQTLVWNIMFLYAFVCYCRYVADMRPILHIMKWAALVFCIPLFIGGMSEVLLHQRLTIMEINPNRIAKFLSYGVIIAVFEQLQLPKEKRTLRSWTVTILMTLVILLTGSRKGIIIPLIGIYLMVCVRKPGKMFKNTLIVMAIAAVVLFMIMHIDLLYQIIGRRMEALLQFVRAEEYDDGSISSRMDYIRLAWTHAQERPVLGHGLDCFRLLRYSSGTYSHCNYVELLYSLGWVGTILYYCPFVYGIVRMVTQYQRRRLVVIIAAGLLIPFIICDYFNVTYFDRISLLIPAITLMAVDQRGLTYETKTAP